MLLFWLLNVLQALVQYCVKDYYLVSRLVRTLLHKYSNQA